MEEMQQLLSKGDFYLQVMCEKLYCCSSGDVDQNNKIKLVAGNGF